MDDREKATEYIIKKLLEGRTDVFELKKEAAVKFSLGGVIRNSEILGKGKKLPKYILRILLKKPTRTISGVTPIAVMIKPEGSCRHGCIYCPFTGKAAKSYTGREPAALRAIQSDFKPEKQVESRLRQYEEMGHPTDKCEIIIMGGTFLEMPEDYKQEFIKKIYETLNGKIANTLEEAIRTNETAKHRVVGLTIETRPDVCGENEIDEMLRYGGTRVELGVQHPDNDIYKAVERGHTVEDVIKATALLKNSAFKVLYHIMPGMPGSNPEKDIEMIKKIFDDERFRPDMLKIYPTLVVGETKLYDMVKRGEYAPYSTEEAVEVISEFYRYIPEYVRVMRIQRDIPIGLINLGVKKSNLRELIEKRIRDKKITPKEIRSREIGPAGGSYHEEDFSIKRLEYTASGGTEIFLSCENKARQIAGFLRLRINASKSHRKELDEKTALVRELHVYGSEVGIGEEGTVQHKGIGKRLLENAEIIAKEDFDMKKLAIISGVGVREYYRKFGYKLIDPYVIKIL